MTVELKIMRLVKQENQVFPFFKTPHPPNYTTETLPYAPLRREAERYGATQQKASALSASLKGKCGRWR